MRRALSLIGVCALLAGALVALTTPSAGALIQVSVANSLDSGAGSLRQAVLDANNGGPNDADDVEITIPASVGTITLTSGELLYDGGDNNARSLTLLGGGNTIVQTTASSRVINLTGQGNFTMNRLVLTGGDTPGLGGGITSFSVGTITITNSTITNNRSGDSGGGIYTFGALALTNSTVSGNEALNAAGGLFVGGNATVTGSTISGNAASNGAGIHGTGTITLTNSTVSGNTAANSAGGFLVDGTLVLVYATVVGNTSLIGGANIDYGASSPLTSFGSVVALPLGGGANCSDQGATTSQGYNWEDTNTCGFGAGTGDLVNAGDPGLGALANNGGPTMTRLPQTGSGLLDKIPASSPCAGVNITVDQRGLPRPTTLGQFCDIGAVEVPSAGAGGTGTGGTGGAPTPITADPRLTG